MKRLYVVLWLLVVVWYAVRAEAALWYVATNGSDANPGSEAAPFYKISKAADVAGPGDFIFVRGGTFHYTQTIRITNSGTAGAAIRLWAYTNELPVLNFAGMADNGTNRGILISTNINWWHIKGLEIGYAGDNGMKIEGSHHLIERCVFHHNRDTGLQIGLGDSDADIPDRVGSNVVLNCDSYLNYDPRANGGNADGFACKLHPGRGNAFIGCRAWENSDDGVRDLYKNEFDVLLEDCWTWHNGDPASFGQVKAGNAGGFKLGGDTGFSGPRLVKRCIAFKNHYGSSGAGKAFHQNDHQGSIVLLNCLSFSNNYNYALNNSGGEHIVKNCVSFDPFGNDHKLVSSNTGPEEIYVSNSWNMAVSPGLADYTPLTEAAAKAPRGAEGSLPPFARLVAGSGLIDRGVDVGLPYTGSAPDLGPFEYAAAQLQLLLSAPRWTNGVFQVQVSGLSAHGPVVLHASSNLADWTPVVTNPAVAGAAQLADPGAGAAKRFYRVEER